MVIRKNFKINFAGVDKFSTFAVPNKTGIKQTPAARGQGEQKH